MDLGRTVFENKPEGSRRRGRPRMRWLEDAEKDEAVDKEEWVFVFKEAKALRMP
jgi:hypothetical protein